MKEPEGGTEASLADLGNIITGRTPPSGRAGCFGGTCPFITPSDMIGQKYIRGTERYLSGEGQALLHRCVVPAGSVTVSCIGWQMGKAGMIDRDSVTNQQLNTIVPNSRVDPHYLYYSLLARREELKRLGSVGTRTPIVNKSVFSRLRVQIPPIHEQHRIADILSAYDDLVENCERRIRVLDQMARALYREWFVKFRYPGYEKVPLVDSPLGRIPLGWKCTAFTEFADVLSGGTPKTDVPDYWDGEIPFFTPRDAPDCCYVRDTEKHLSAVGLSECASPLFPSDTVFITARGTVGNLAMASRPMAMNQSCYALRSRAPYSQRFLYLFGLEQVEYLRKNTGGATFATIVVDTFRRMRVIVPLGAITGLFSQAVDPLFDAILSLDKRAGVLRKTRDLLLPRLLSGQLSVSSAP